MRIISGRFKGRRLVSFNEKHIRPTTDRVKETIFNKIMGSTHGARVLDLFCGTGSLGLEALSRGAIDVVFVDKSHRSLAVLKKNIAALGVEGEVEVLNKDIFKYLKEAPTEPFNIVFLDPPFTEKIADQSMKALSVSNCLCDGGLAVIESGSKETVVGRYGPLLRVDERDFGDKTLSIFRKESKA